MLSKGVTDDLEELHTEVLAKSAAKRDAIRRAAAAEAPLPASKGALARSVSAARKKRLLAKPKPKAAPKVVAKTKKAKVLKEVEPKKVKARKPEEKPKKPVAYVELKMTAKCIKNRAYENARNKTFTDGESPTPTLVWIRSPKGHITSHTLLPIMKDPAGNVSEGWLPNAQKDKIYIYIYNIYIYTCKFIYI